MNVDDDDSPLVTFPLFTTPWPTIFQFTVCHFYAGFSKVGLE